MFSDCEIICIYHFRWAEFLITKSTHTSAHFYTVSLYLRSQAFQINLKSGNKTTLDERVGQRVSSRLSGWFYNGYFSASAVMINRPQLCLRAHDGVQMINE